MAAQSWALEVFLNFFKHKNVIFLHFYQVYKPISAPVLFKKPTPSQINLIKNAKSFFVIIKFQKYRKCPALPLWRCAFCSIGAVTNVSNRRASSHAMCVCVCVTVETKCPLIIPPPLPCWYEIPPHRFAKIYIIWHNGGGGGRVKLGAQ